MVVDNLVGSHGSQWANFSSGIRVIRSKRVKGSAMSGKIILLGTVSD